MVKSIDVFTKGSSSNTYLIDTTPGYILVDPSNNYNYISKITKDKKIIAILLTHGHYDHFIEINKYEGIPIYLHKKAYTKLLDSNESCAKLFNQEFKLSIKESLFNFVQEQVLEIEGIKIQVILLPGHSNCSVAYLIDNNLFVGDTLFLDSVGRWDLPTGNYITLKESLKRIKSLNHNLICYPGHDESFVLSDACFYNPYLKNI